jgi:four helix bundle protein
MFNFEKRDAWKKAISPASSACEAAKAFPPGDRFGLTNQIRRAAVSIGSNIAEGSVRPPAVCARFAGIASGSLSHLVTQPAIARNEGFLSVQNFEQIHRDAEPISRRLSGPRKSPV